MSSASISCVPSGTSRFGPTASTSAAEEVSTLVARMQGVYGAGKGTLDGKPINGSDIEAGRAARGHVFNLGHGVLPSTDPDQLKRLTEFVQGYQV